MSGSDAVRTPQCGEAVTKMTQIFNLQTLSSFGLLSSKRHRSVCRNGTSGSQSPRSEDITRAPCCSSKFLSHGEVERDPFTSKSLQTLERNTPGLPVLLVPTSPVNSLACSAIVNSSKKHFVGPRMDSATLGSPIHWLASLFKGSKRWSEVVWMFLTKAEEEEGKGGTDRKINKFLVALHSW